MLKCKTVYKQDRINVNANAFSRNLPEEEEIANLEISRDLMVNVITRLNKNRAATKPPATDKPPPDKALVSSRLRSRGKSPKNRNLPKPQKLKFTIRESRVQIKTRSKQIVHNPNASSDEHDND